MKIKKSTINVIKVFVLTILTLGIYGAYWAMTQSFEEDDYSEDETKKDADNAKRAVAAAMLARHDLNL